MQTRTPTFDQNTRTGSPATQARRPSALAAGLAALLLSGAAQAAEFSQVQADKSQVAFSYKQMGVGMDGKFTRFQARLAFDPALPAQASAQIEIDLAGIDTGSKEANAEVLGKDWFNAKVHPQARFKSSSVKVLGGGRYEALGQLSIKGRTLDVSAPFTFRQDGASGVFEGGFVIKRLDYAIGEGAWSDLGAVANEIPVKFRIVALAAPAATSPAKPASVRK